MRIVSLIASATEIVHGLGLFDFMVGRSHECDYPGAVLALPVCTSPKFNVEGSSLEIDQQVRRIVSESLSVYRVDADLLQELDPSHIITQSQCEVCAVSLHDVEAAVCTMVSSQPKVVSLQPDSLQDVFADIRRVGAALECNEKAEALIKSLADRIEAIRSRTSVLPKKSVAFIEWIEPLMAGGNWMPTLIAYAGGTNLFGVENKHSPYMELQQLFEADPDVIVISPCGFDLKRTLKELDALYNLPEWSQLTSVRNNQVVLADGNQFFNRPGPRLVESLEILAEVIHPNVFSFGHEGTGWLRAPLSNPT